MKRHSMPEMKEGGVNVTPLIDIVMCLIIFFMLVAKIGVKRGVDEIRLPEAVLGTKIEDLSDSLTINLHHLKSESGPAMQVTALVGDNIQEIFPKEWKSTFAAFQKVHQAKSKIIIRADDDLPYGELEKILFVLQESNIKDTAYETKRAPGDGDDDATAAAPAAAAATP